MNDVTKKRLIGVAILVIIGVLAPLLLSRCMHGDDSGGDRSSMRVYEVKPDGETKTTNNDQQGQPEGAASSSSTNHDSEAQAAHPDAVSPQNSSDFSTPPVHGNSGGASGESDSADASSREHSQPSEPTPKQSASNNDRSRNQPKPSAHDYGASSTGSESAHDKSRPNQTHAASGGSSSGLERSSIQGWVIQVASFSEQGNAQDMARKLKGQFSASYTPGQVNGKTLYRVNVGPFDSEKAARNAADKLSQAGHKGLVRHLP